MKGKNIGLMSFHSKMKGKKYWFNEFSQQNEGGKILV
jgi:hypothetical protein